MPDSNFHAFSKYGGCRKISKVGHVTTERPFWLTFACFSGQFAC